jgi:hypothetical protein
VSFFICVYKSIKAGGKAISVADELEAKNALLGGTLIVLPSGPKYLS